MHVGHKNTEIQWAKAKPGSIPVFRNQPQMLSTNHDASM